MEGQELNAGTTKYAKMKEGKRDDRKKMYIGGCGGDIGQ